MATVVFLSGPSCSGKSALARALQAQLPTPIVLVEADRAFPTLPEEHPLWPTPDRHGAVVLAFHRSIAAWASSGFDLIVDGSLPYASPDLRSACLQLFEGFQVILVGVTCDPDVLAQRENARGVATPGWALRQSRDINDGLRLDASVDTSSEAPEDCARRVISTLGWDTDPQAAADRST